jgi:hypothetical protein
VIRFAVGAIALLLASSAVLTTREAISASPVSIPEKQWIPLRLPPDGTGISRMDKHVTPTFCPLNNRVYFTGGDYVGKSYRQETWSLDVAERLRNSSDPAAGWRLEYPFCGPKGAPQPKGPDFVGWTWDSRRNVFWMVPGEMQPSGPYSQNCPGQTPAYSDDVSAEGPRLLYRHIMTFDPVTKSWADYDTNINGRGSDTWYSVYDPVTDSIIRPSPGHTMGIYDIKQKSWANHPLGSNALGRDPQILASHFATDYEKRRIFIIDPQSGRLHRWDMDGRKLIDLGSIPKGPILKANEGSVIADKGYAVWDSNARILIHYRYNHEGIFIYHPDEPTPRWEPGNFPMAEGGPSGLGVHWNGAAFDPVNNVMIGIGHRDYLLLFRYNAVTRSPAPSAKQ